jgi:TatD DNase family protein
VKPAVDAHAHLRPNLTSDQVEGIRGAFVMAVTRSPAEWSTALRRRDRRIAWGLGCHPGDAAAIAAFDETKLAAVASKAAFFGEIGLDARSKVPAGDQERVLAAFLRVSAIEGVVTSVHSAGRSSRTLDLIEAARASRVILHWWGGSREETNRAIDLGCFFSVNGAMSADVLASLPLRRVLTETDFPATASRDRSVDRPGAVSSVEQLLIAAWGSTTEDLREGQWSILRELDTRGGRLAGATASVAG